MRKDTVRNALVMVGAWSASAAVASLITLVLIPLNNRLTFHGDAGVVMMWIWSGVPQTLTSAAAAATAAWVIQSRRTLRWIGGLTALYLYGGILNALQQRRGWLTAPNTADDIGIGIQAIVPALACLVTGIWTERRLSTARRE
jgi:hypothetical protein